jgi:prepilin-type N-terminal cleavage/methylation domain-containing protein
MNKGFTLLEVIIVIIIIGVLASLALPRLFSVIEFSKSAEALAAIATIRSSVERCYLMNNGSYSDCRAGSTTDNDWSNSTLDIPDPSLAANAQFVYAVLPVDVKKGFAIRAVLKTDMNSWIFYEVWSTDNIIRRSGNGVFKAIK